jgi:hypothetical protein
MASILNAGLGFAEIVVYSLAGLGILRHWGLTLAEAAAGAALLPAMLTSLLLQIACLTGWPGLIPGLRLFVLAMALGLIWRYRGPLRHTGRPFGRFLREHPLAAHTLGLSAGSLLVTAVMTGWHDGDFFTPYYATLPAFGCKIMSWQAKSGGHTFLPAAVLLPWTAYLTICLATYALARRYAWPPTAITVTLLVASMPRLVLLAISRRLEIVPAAAALLAILFLYRTVERPTVRDLTLLAAALAFSVSGDRMGLVFPFIGCGLAVVVLYRRHGGRLWWDLLRATPLTLVLAGGGALALCYTGFRSGWLWGTTGSGAAGAYNADGLMGAAANLLRYGLQMIDLTPPVDRALHEGLGFDWPGVRVWLHDHLLTPIFQSKGLAAAFVPARDGATELAWFGPLAGLLVPPALGWALMRGPRRLKTVAFALIGYFLLVVLIPAWLPSNVRYFTLFFVCAGFTTAFLLPPWRMTRRRRHGLQLCALALMVYGISAVWRGL